MSEPTDSDPSDLVPVTAASAWAGIPARTLRHWIATGRVPALAGAHGRLVSRAAVSRAATLLGRPGAAAPPLGGAAARAGPAPGLIGRARELDALRRALGAARAGHGRLVLLSGEAGVGKTALAEALLAEAADAGARTLVGHCYDRAETPPYGPWAEVVRHARNDPAARALSGLRFDAAASQVALSEQVRAALAAATCDRPLLLLLEDLHWADSASLELLRVLARGLAHLPLLALATYRADELERRHPLSALVPLLVREARAARLDLRPLDPAGVRALVDARYDLPEGEAARLAAYLFARTEGNPLFLTELLGTLEDEGEVARAGDGWALGPLAAAPVPLLLRQLVDARVARLGEEAGALLAVAAVVGQEVPLALWARVAGAGDAQVLAVAERAEIARLVAVWPGGDGVRFTHALSREALYEGLPGLMRRRLHRQAGEALAGALGPDPDAVAHHLQRAGDDRAAAWLVRAGERAEAADAVALAADRYEAAFALLDARWGDPGERGWLRLLAAALRRFQDPGRAAAWVAEAASLAAEAADASLAARARALHGLLAIYGGELRAGMARIAGAADAIDRLPPGTGPVGLWERRIDAIANRGTVINNLGYIGHLAEGRAQGERYLAGLSAPAEAAGGTGALADVHNGLAVIFALQGEPALARRSFAAGIAAYDASGYHLATLFLLREELLLAVLPYHADDRAERERVAAAAARLERRLAAAGALGDADDPGYARLPLLALEGRWRVALQVAERPDHLDRMTRMHLRDVVLGSLARARGDAVGAWGHVREAWPAGRATTPGERSVPFNVPLLRLAAALALDDGDLAAARAWLDAHHAWMGWMEATLGRSEGEALEAAWHHVAGDAARARDHAERALAHATVPRQPLALLAAHRLLGTIDTAAGDAATAEGHLDAALALADACTAPYERARTLLARANLLAGQGAVAAARAALEEAQALCLALGAQRALARAAALAARLGAPATGSARATTLRPALGPPGLSGRETEVLRLLAAGLGNAAIAERLAVSPRTVKAHVAHIFGKLGVTNRVAATRFAVEHGLA